jgi:probable poly-beta-1,6-N-acetyl-D-glucosamine export protein
VKNNFLNYIHYFRGLAILLIVGVHCRTALEWQAASSVNNVLIFGLNSSTILFVFISGFLFQYINAAELNYKNYLSKKLKYVVTPYVLVSIPAIADKLFFENDAYWMDSFYKSLYPPFQVFYMLLTGKHSGPYYFIPVICIIYLVAPILFRIQKSNYFTWITAALVAIGLFTYTYGYYASTLESLLYYLPVYIFGMWACKNRDWILNMRGYVWVALAGSYLLIFYFEISKTIVTQHLYFFEPTTHYFTTQFNFGKLKEMILAILLITAFYRFRKKELKSLALLGSYSFGIYFIHIYFINAVERILDYYQLSRAQNGFPYLIFVICVIGLSTMTVYLIKKIVKDRSRLLIGS